MHDVEAEATAGHILRKGRSAIESTFEKSEEGHRGISAVEHTRHTLQRCRRGVVLVIELHAEQHSPTNCAQQIPHTLISQKVVYTFIRKQVIAP